MNEKETKKRFSEGDTVYLKPEKEIQIFTIEKYTVVEVKEETCY